MPGCESRDHASLYAVGLLDPAESSAFEQHLNSCSVCAAEVRASSNLAVQLASAPPIATPPSWVRERVLSGAKLPRGVLALARRQNLEWRSTPFEGISMARLFEDPVRGELASLVRMLPGSHYPSHRHAAVEHCLVIEGDIVFEDHTLFAGDYSAGGQDRDHTSATTKNGCLLFIVHHIQDQVHAR